MSQTPNVDVLEIFEQMIQNFHAKVAQALQAAAQLEVERVLAKAIAGGMSMPASVSVVVKVGDVTHGDGWDVRPITGPPVVVPATIKPKRARAVGSSLAKASKVITTKEQEADAARIKPKLDQALGKSLEIGLERAKRGRGRPQGEIGKVVVVYLETQQESRDPASIHRELELAGLECSKDNLHQILRRLTAKGEIKRVRRGMYARLGAQA